jgi:8-oxo-dGTP diphosphatase
VACAVAVIVTHQRQVLFGKRCSGETEILWQLPGGWIEAGESPQQAARREVSEETGLQLSELRFVGLSNNIFSACKHSLSLYFEAECVDAGSLFAGERDKCAGWEWRDWNEIGENLYLPLRLFRQTEYRPFASDEFRTHVAL